MIFDQKNAVMIFSDDSKVHAAKCTVGIVPEGGLVHGFEKEFDDNALTPAQRIELADAMIAQWTKYKLRVKDGMRQPLAEPEQPANVSTKLEQ